MGQVFSDSALAPNGRRVTISCRDVELQPGWMWHGRLSSKTVAVGVTVGMADYWDRAVEFNGATQAERIRYGNRPLIVGTDPQGSWMSVWQGPHHSLVFGGAASVPTLSMLVSILDDLSIVDRPEGLVVTPRPLSGLVLWSMIGYKFTSAGLISVLPRAEAATLVPHERGQATEYGEVWANSLRIDGQIRGRKYVHATATAITIIDDDLGRVPEVTRSGQEALLTSLDVRWDG